MMHHVGDDAGRVGGHQRVDVEFDEIAGIELLIAQSLIKPLLLGFHLFLAVLSVPIKR